jgi:hypothetical protein
MIVELAIATGTAPRDWWDESPEVLVTAFAVLEARARAQKNAMARARGRR